MTDIALRAYNHEIESMIEQGQRLDEAVAHCRHILAIYPKHLDTYRLLGKAYLEAKRHDQAVDIFQRVLVSAPDDFVSHVGMSIIGDDQGQLDDAIWHMERAFEVQPSNAAIQAELQRLFGRRDGVEPPKIRLTRGALAHMYVQGELYTQAISEIRAVLATDPERMDMQVLLARAYFRNGQKTEAADICSALLAISPYCLDANRLMAEILPGTQATEAAQECRRRVLDLDPYAEFARGSISATDSVADGSVTLQHLEYSGGEAELGAVTGMALVSGPRAAETAGAVPSWLASEASSAAAREAAPEPDQDLPDFLRGSGWHEAPAESSDVPGSVPPTYEAETASESDVVAGELPEWVRALAPNSEQELAADSSAQKSPSSGWLTALPSSTETQADAASGAVDDTPDWLRELAKGAEPPYETAAPEREANPALQVEESEPGGVSLGDSEKDNGLAWLEGLAEKHGASSERFLTPREARAQNPPDWIEKLGQDEAPAPEDWKPIDKGLTDTVSQVAEAPDGSSSSAAGSSLNWLSGLADPNAFAEMEKPAENDEMPFPDDATALTRSSASAPESIPDWLADKPQALPAPSPAVAREPSGEYESNVDLPDWLAGLDGPMGSPAPTGGPEDESTKVPDWLQPASQQQESAVGASQWRPVEADAPPAEKPALPQPESATMPPEAPQLLPTQAVAAGRDALPPRTRPVNQAPAAEVISLGAAKVELTRGNIAAALEMYGRLIRKGKSLTEIIRELRDALYRYPVEVPIWQALGDAYMRADRLQEALDAYTKAEELLR